MASTCFVLSMVSCGGENSFSFNFFKNSLSGRVSQKEHIARSHTVNLELLLFSQTVFIGRDIASLSNVPSSGVSDHII